MDRLKWAFVALVVAIDIAILIYCRDVLPGMLEDFKHLFF